MAGSIDAVSTSNVDSLYDFDNYSTIVSVYEWVLA